MIYDAEAALADLVAPMAEEILFELVIDRLAEAMAQQIVAGVPELSPALGPTLLSGDGGLALDVIEI